MKKLMIVISVLLLSAGMASGQSFLEKLGKSAMERAKESVEKKTENAVENAVDKAVDGAFNTVGNIFKKKDKGDQKNGAAVEEEAVAQPAEAAGWTCEECGKEGNTGNFCDECGAKKPGASAAPAAPAPAPKKQTASNYAKSDFVPGDEIIFEDTFENEKLGEFPAQWDLMDGYAEVGEVDGRKVIAFTDNGVGELRPLMKDQEHFLSDVFTLEFDVYAEVGEDLGDESLEIAFGNPDVDNWNGRVIYVEYRYRGDGSSVFM